jgi:hypothetical protein
MNLTSIKFRALAAALLTVIVAVGSPQAAAAKTPTGVFAPFYDCPVSAPNVSACIITQTTGGELTVGGATLKVSRPLILQGGIAEEPEVEGTIFVPAANGDTLSATPLELPGGLLGLFGKDDREGSPPGWGGHFERFNTVTAIPELVGAVQLNIISILTGEGPALVLPIRVHLYNRLLGARCYVGSAAEPIALRLTDGTTSPPAPNQPISGSSGTLSIEDEGSVVTLSGSVLVDNAFSVPGAEGCGAFGSLDRVIDRLIGLPSPAGRNTAILDSNELLASASAVLASEEQ